MGYMQEIIRRGNVKYFISQKQEDINKPVDNVGDIGAGSAWYVQEERPVYEQAVMSNYQPGGAAGEGMPIPSNLEKYSDQWFYLMRGAQTNQRYNELMGGNIDFENICGLFKPPWYGSGWNLFNYSSNLSISLGILLLQNYSKQELKNYCLSYPDINFLDLEGYRTGLPFYIESEPYNNMIQYISLLDKNLSTKNAKLGVRLDKENRTFFFGVKGKAYLPQNMTRFFSPIFYTVGRYNGTVGSTYYTYPKNYFQKLKEIFSDQKTKILFSAFDGLEHGLYRTFSEVPENAKRIKIAPWTFSQAENMNSSFSLVGTKLGNDVQWAKEPDGTNFFLSNMNPYCPYIIQELDLTSLNTRKTTNMNFMFSGQQNIIDQPLVKIFVSQNFVVDQVISSNGMFGWRKGLVGGAGTVWSSSNPTDKTYARWDEGASNPGYFWNPNVMNPLVLVPGPQFNAVWLAAVNAAAVAAGSDRAPSIQQITGEFTFVSMSTKPSNLQTLLNNNVKESGDGEAYIGYTYNVTDRSFKVYLVSDNIGEGNIKANPNCTDMFALDSAVPGSLTMNVEWLNTSQVINMENMFGIKGV